MKYKYFKNKSSGLPIFENIVRKIQGSYKTIKYVSISNEIDVYVNSRLFGPYVHNKFLNGYKPMILKRTSDER